MADKATTKKAAPKAKKVAFQTRVVTHEGRRGRPANPVGHTELRIEVRNSKGKPMGEVTLSAGDNGEVKLSAKSNGTSRHLTFALPPAEPKATKNKPKATPAPEVVAA